LEIFNAAATFVKGISQAARRFKQKVLEEGRLRRLLREIVSRSNLLIVEI
jgi:hypothetical protein